jgi:hypothetical protein
VYLKTLSSAFRGLDSGPRGSGFAAGRATLRVWFLKPQAPIRLYPPAPIHLDEERLRRAASLRREIPDLAAPRALARFLTGLPSPRLTRAKLKSHPLFGAFAHVPFAEVLRRVEAGEGGRL